MQLNATITFYCMLLFFSTAICANESSLSACEQQPANAIISTQTLALFGTPKYPDNFQHLDYVNPHAPKRGQIVLAAIGSFDNFNRYASRGTPVVKSDELYDTFFANTDDEVGIYYPLIAQSVRYADNFCWIEVTINPDARFHDQQPITANDVVFTFNKFMKEGVIQYRNYYKGVTVNKVSKLVVRVTFPDSNKEKALGFVASFPVLPEHGWQQYDLSQPLATPPLSSGPYFIADYKMGQYVIYQRKADYWATNLPVNKGRYNFDTIRYDYYLDDNVALEAFKAGTYDLRAEGQPKNWQTHYTGNHFTNGDIVKLERPLQSAPDTRWLAFNTSRSIFQDRRVREAITLAFDFEWQNRALYYSAFQRIRSYFTNTTYEAQKLPTDEELIILKPYIDQLPPEILTQVYHPPKSDGSGFNRANLLKATALLNEAGWQLRNNRLFNRETGKPFEFELLLYLHEYAPYAFSFQQNLARLGIKMTITVNDITRLNHRLRKRDYDIMPTRYYSFAFPSNGLKIIWGSEHADSSWNATGFTSPVIDALLDQITQKQDNPTTLLALGRALDRVLTWNYLMIPTGYLKYQYYAYWDKFSFPIHYPPHALGLTTWWSRDASNQNNQKNSQ